MYLSNSLLFIAREYTGRQRGAQRPAAAQAALVAAGSAFLPGARELFSTNFSEDADGEFPKRLQFLRGSMQVVQHDGRRMLRSASQSEFVIPLPETLPARFTLEFDVVARDSNCCAGEELAFEGTPALSRSSDSAQVLWHHQYLAILGGGENMTTSTLRLKEPMQEQLLGKLSEVRVAFDGPKFRLYTNGVQLYDIARLAFVRGRVLRVFLGGRNDAERAVYLARIRVAASGTAAPTVVRPPAMVVTAIDPTNTGPASTTPMQAPSPPNIALPGFAATGLFGRPPPQLTLRSSRARRSACL